MRFLSNEPKLDFNDVLIIPKTSDMESRNDVDLYRTFKLKHAGWSISCIPIISANMDTTGTARMAKALSQYGMLTALHKHHSTEDVVNCLNDIEYNPFAFFTIGTSDSDLDRLKTLMEYTTPQLICIDVANGYTYQFLTRIEEVRELCPRSFIMAGNVVTPEKTEQVILAGADCVKVGIGPGSVCTTRIKTGVGYPQLSAIIECADSAHGLDGLICGDGGCNVPGDVVKAFAGGADFVMLGGMFAGTAECDGDKIAILEDGTHYQIYPYDPTSLLEIYGNTEIEPTHMRFYGMSSKTANDRYSGGLDDYRAAEGKEVLVEYKGEVKNVVDDLLGGLRSAMTYTGARKLKELTKRATFVIVNNQHNQYFN